MRRRPQAAPVALPQHGIAERAYVTRAGVGLRAERRRRPPLGVGAAGWRRVPGGRTGASTNERAPPRAPGGGAAVPAAARHGPAGGGRVPPVPGAADRLGRRRPRRGARLPRRRGAAGAARLQPLLLAPAAHGARVLLPADGGAAGVLPRELPAARLLPQGQGAGALGPPAARAPLRPPGAGHHQLQQAPERQGALRHLARPHGAAGRAVRRHAVRGGGAPALPQAGEELDAGQAEAVPRDLGAGGVPSGLCQPDAGHVLLVVHHLGDRRLLVPLDAVSHSHQPGYHEPGEQRLPVPQAEPALRPRCGSELPLCDPAGPGLCGLLDPGSLPWGF